MSQSFSNLKKTIIGTLEGKVCVPYVLNENRIIICYMRWKLDGFEVRGLNEKGKILYYYYEIQSNTQNNYQSINRVYENWKRVSGHSAES